MNNALDYLNRLVGRWLLTGKMGEVAIRQDVSCDWTVGSTFLRMYFKSTTSEDNPASDYEAVYHLGFNEDEQLYVMHLLDTTEVPTECVMGVGRREGNSIPFVFKYGQTEFTNTFTWQPEQDGWRFRQTYVEDGETKVFAEKEMTRPKIIVEAIDHLSLSVTDLDRSARFYEEVLGVDLTQVPLEYSDELNAGSFYFSVGDVEITLLKHDQTEEGDRFSEFRVGLDHLSFRVGSEDELDDVVRRLDRNGIENRGIQLYQPSGKKYVVVRDPDNIQLEFWLDDVSR